MSDILDTIWKRTLSKVDLDEDEDIDIGIEGEGANKDEEDSSQLAQSTQDIVNQFVQDTMQELQDAGVINNAEPQKQKSIIKRKTDEPKEEPKYNPMQELNALGNIPVSTFKLSKAINNGSIHSEAISIYLKQIFDDISNFLRNNTFEGGKQASAAHATMLGNIAYLTDQGLTNDTQNTQNLLNILKEGRINSDPNMARNCYLSFNQLLKASKVKNTSGKTIRDYDLIDGKAFSKWEKDYDENKDALIDAYMVDNGFEDRESASNAADKNFGENVEFLRKYYSEPSLEMGNPTAQFNKGKRSKDAFAFVMNNAHPSQEIYKNDKVIKIGGGISKIEDNIIFRNRWGSKYGSKYNADQIWKHILKGIEKTFANTRQGVREVSILGEEILVNGRTVVLDNDLVDYMESDELQLSLSNIVDYKALLARFPRIRSLHIDEVQWDILIYQYAEDGDPRIPEDVKVWRNFMLPNKSMQQITIEFRGGVQVIRRDTFANDIRSNEYSSAREIQKAEKNFNTSCNLLNPNLNAKGVGEQLSLTQRLSSGAFDRALNAGGIMNQNLNALLVDSNVKLSNYMGKQILAGAAQIFALSFGFVFSIFNVINRFRRR